MLGGHLPRHHGQITAHLPEGAARTRALALSSAAAASAGSVGLILGGVLTTGLSWRYVLLVNVPVGAALLLLAGRAVPASAPVDVAARHLDLPGAACVTLGTAALTYALSQASTQGWDSARVVAAVALASVLLLAFVCIERVVRRPLIPLGIFAQRSLAVGNLLMAGGGIILTGTLFYLSLYCQQILGYSALDTGLAVLPMTVLLVAGSFACRSLIPLVGARMLLLAGIAPTVGGLAWLADLPTRADYVGRLLGPIILIGAGIGLMILPLTVLATSAIDPRFAGLASGFLNTGRQLGGALGLALLVTVASAVTRHLHGNRTTDIVDGFRAAFALCAATGLATAALTTLLPGPRAGHTHHAPH